MIPQAEVLRQSSNPFLASDAPTLADVINGIEANDSLSESRRRDICSAVRTLARLLNKSPKEVPASRALVRNGSVCGVLYRRAPCSGVCRGSCGFAQVNKSRQIMSMTAQRRPFARHSSRKVW
jgi:hypothetical protein